MEFEPGSPLWIAAVAAAQLAVIALWVAAKKPLHHAFLGVCWLLGRVCRPAYRMIRPLLS